MQWCDAQGTSASVLALINDCGQNHPPRRQAIIAISCTGAISLLPADGDTAGIATAAGSTTTTTTTLLEVRSVNALAQAQLGVDGPETYAMLLHLSDPLGLNQLGLLLKVAALSATMPTATAVSVGEAAPRTLLPMQPLPHAAPSSAGGGGGGPLAGSSLEIMAGGGQPCGHAAAAPQPHAAAAAPQPHAAVAAPHAAPQPLLLLRHFVPEHGHLVGTAAADLRPLRVLPASALLPAATAARAPSAEAGMASVGPVVAAEARVVASEATTTTTTLTTLTTKSSPAGSIEKCGGADCLLDHVPDILSLCLIGGNVIYQV